MLVPLTTVATKENIVKGTLYNQAHMEPLPSYMARLDSGQVVIDIDHPDWKIWLEIYHNKKNYLNSDKIKMQALTKSTVEAIREIFEPDNATLKKLLISINEKFTAAVDG